MTASLNWIVVPGGPCLSNNYLKYAFVQMALKKSLHFYDMLGSPESADKTPSLAELTEQIPRVANDAQLSEYGLITHSFGNHVAMQALRKDGHKIKAILMLNPMPFEYKKWQAAIALLNARVPAAVLDRISTLSQMNEPKAEAEIFRLIYPYYLGNKEKTLPVDVRIDITACNSIASKIPVYNDIALVTTTSVPIVRIVGELDPFYNERDMLTQNTIIISNVGHYPFFEDPNGLHKAMQQAEKLLSHIKPGRSD